MNAHVGSDCLNLCINVVRVCCLVHIYSFTETDFPMGPFKYIGFTTGMMRPVNLIMKWKQLTISMKRDVVGCWQLAPNTQSAVSVTDT